MALLKSVCVFSVCSVRSETEQNIKGYVPHRDQVRIVFVCVVDARVSCCGVKCVANQRNSNRHKYRAA